MYKERPKVGLSSRRLEIVDRAFQKLDTKKSGFVNLTEIIRVYDATRHPRVLDGSMSPSQALQQLLNFFEPCAILRNGTISLEEFLGYYAKMSVEVDRGREQNPDEYFERVVARFWRLDEDQLVRLQPTNIIPVTLDVPTGLLAMTSMDLIWAVEGGKIVGYKGVVKPVFGRKILPEAIRGMCAISGELSRFPHEYIPSRPAMLPPFDLVWEIEEGGPWTGLQGVVTSNINPAALPAHIQQHVITHEEAVKRNVTFIPLVAVANVFYKKSSEVVGQGTEGAATRLFEVKKSTYEGNACGNGFAGRNGSFSNQFIAGMYSTASLNVGSVKK